MPRIVHFELPVDDPDRAREFYASVFDWELSGFGDTGYWLADTGAEGEIGIDGALITRSELHTAPVVVINVDDIHAGLRRAAGAGAEVLKERHAVPGMGWAAYFRDPEGNIIGLWQSDETASGAG